MSVQTSYMSMSYNIVLTARKGIGWVGERGDDVGVLAEEKHRKVKPNRVAPGVVRSRDVLRISSPASGCAGRGNRIIRPRPGRIAMLPSWCPVFSTLQVSSLKPNLLLALGREVVAKRVVRPSMDPCKYYVAY